MRKICSINGKEIMPNSLKEWYIKYCQAERKRKALYLSLHWLIGGGFSQKYGLKGYLYVSIQPMPQKGKLL